MVYGFSDIYNKEFYSNSRVVIIAGQYPIFNDLVVDKFKELYKSEVENAGSEMLEEFGLDTENTEQLNRVDFEDFFKVLNTPPLQGKWFCYVQYSELNKKQREKLDSYCLKPSDNGVLLVSIAEFKDFSKYLRNRALKSLKESNLIKLSFPDRSTLHRIINDMLTGVATVEYKAVALFIMRLGNDYNEYSSLLERIRLKYQYSVLTYKDMLYELKGIENYAIDDFIVRLAQPLETDKISKRKKIYTIQKALVNDVGYRGLVSKLRYKIKDILEMRILINNGEVPLGVRYNVKKIQNKLPEKHSLRSLSEYSFKKTSAMAEKFCLRDLVLIMLLLNTVDNSSSDYDYARVITNIVNRTALTKDRLLNDIRISDNLKDEIVLLSSMQYKENTDREAKRIIIDELYHV